MTHTRETHHRLAAGAAAVLLLLILAGCGKTAEFDADAYRRDQEETIGFTFLREVPDYAQAAAHPVAIALPAEAVRRTILTRSTTPSSWSC